MNTRTTFLSISIAICLLLALTACSRPAMQGTQQQGAQQGAPQQNNAAVPADPAAPAEPAGGTVAMQKTAESAEVRITDMAFQPASIVIKAGGTVSWTNEDSVAHTVKFAESESEQIGKGGTFSMTFATPGSYEYACGIHPSMKGVVVVE